MATLLTGIAHLDEPVPAWWSRLGYELEPVVAVAAAADAAPTISTSPTHDMPPVVIEEGLALARATASDGRQRAIGLEVGGLEALYELRLQLRRACRSQPRNSPLLTVQPWLWSAATSGGAAMTRAGLHTGYEVRLSRARRTT
jgi:hypothetical protein